MPYDIKKYRKHVMHLELTPDQQDELIHIVCNIMQNFVDRAWRDDPVQMSGYVSKKSDKNAFKTPPVIDLKAKEISRIKSNLAGRFNNKTQENRKGSNEHE